ncbi:glycosyl hydrolase 2 galactose-binding domain-containing protein [Microlunatus antarcticus]|uniref:Exo-1,4-beta-D-glucosaminidase n=1 Tax=Microlunatus antarcticus TaxID=53388 RepID=A0A7W5JVN8_9ACTN|nr:beta-mannosidase [Microlunatus antarcticus]MBB3327207.1 exo-1,4-beta-D-glucosaminidase [Microlunatus antarcticus]
MITSRRLAVVSAASALVLATTWLGGGAASADTPTPAPAAAPSASPTTPSAPASAPALAQGDLSRLLRTDAPADLGTTTLGRQGWRVVSTATEHGSGNAVSQTGHSTKRWLPVKPDDGGAPGTEINALLQNGACPKVFYSDNLKKCFGTQETGPETVKRFAVPWWYRTTFATPKHGDHAELITNGVVGEADVWVNGTRVATRSTITGAYTQHRLDVSRLLRAKGANTVAIKVYPNDPLKYFTVSNIDWTQIPPDQNTGIQFPVQLQSSAGVELSDSHVVQDTSADLSSTRLTVSAKVTNVTGRMQHASVAALVVAPDDAVAPVYVTKQVDVGAGTTQVSITPADDPALTIRHPQVWWPYRMGAQPLYTLVTALATQGSLVNSTTSHFGVRTTSSALVGAGPLAPGGVRQYTINGQPLVLRGGGFDPDLFLRYSAADTAQQIRLLKSAGLNTVRVEGHFMPQDFYDQMDDAGILVASGYSCCDAWELPTDTPTSSHDLGVLTASAYGVARSLRDHPSVFTFQWSDNNPTAPQEAVTLKAFAAEDFDVPTLASAEYKSSPQLGLAGEKEGPYDWVPPSYWYDREHSSYADDSSLTNAGGAWALDSEESAGHTVPTRDSMNRFLSPADQRKLWQDPKANQYHANAETGTTGYAFGTLDNFDTALTKRYGSWSDLDGYVREAQLANYENVRAQFEAFILHSADPRTPSTGTIYWMANKGWPTLLWALYNADYDQAGSFFGAQEANRPLHALFDPSTKTVSVDNLTGQAASDLTVDAKVVGTDGTVLDARRSGALGLAGQQVRNGVLPLSVPATTTTPAKASTYLVELVLRRGSTVVDRNTYWYSTQADVVDWGKTLGNPQATMTQYGDLTGLHGLARATVSVTTRTTRHGGTATTAVTVTNTSSATAFFLRADVRRGTASGHRRGGDDQVRTATWSANDTSLAPGESQTITATYARRQLHGDHPVVTVGGWNVPTATH